MLFKNFIMMFRKGVFPDDKNIVEIDEKELDTFLNNLEKKVSR